MPSIKGTASVSDARARSKALKATRFPRSFSKPVNLEKINKPVLTQWIEQKVTSILGFEDEIVSSTAINLFLPTEGGSPDPRRAQLDLVGFLGETESATFAKELWNLMLEAESSTSGIPRSLLEQKKKELSQQKSAAAKPHEAPSRPSQNRHDQDVGRRRNPEMNRFVQEAARRAEAARQMMGDQPAPPGGRRDGGPDPIPVSPPHPSEQGPNSRGGPRRGERQQDRDRKMPSRDHPGRGDLHPPPHLPLRDGDFPPRAAIGRNNNDDRGEGRRPHRSSRSRSRSLNRGGRRREDDWRREEDRRRDIDRRRREDSGRGDRRRYYDEDDEIEELERRLAILKKQCTKRGDNYALDEEIEGVKDRLYEVERRRRRRRREREEEYRRRKRHDQRRRRSRSRSRGGESESRRRRSSRSPDNDRRRRSPSSDSDRRRRSPSSESDASSRSSSSESGSDHRNRKTSSNGPQERDGSRKERDTRRSRKDRSQSSGGSSSSDYSEESRK